jgi:hypothetical protein
MWGSAESGPTFEIWRVNAPCWYAYKERPLFDLTIVAGFDPARRHQAAILYAGANAPIQAVALGIAVTQPYIISFRPPIVTIGYRRSARRSYFDLATGRLVRI